MDHTLLDIELVDDDSREPMGRPWVTICIDIYTRMVVGFSLNLHAPSAHSAGQAVINAILPKTKILEELGIEEEWPCFGIMLRLHMDNGKEFHGKMLEEACELYEIDMEYRPPGKPNWGAHIERYMKTLADHLKTYRGSTHGAKDKKLKRKPRKHATMTVREFERSLLTFILGTITKGFTRPLESRLSKNGNLVNSVRSEILELELLLSPENTI